MISLWHWAGCGGALGARWSPRAPWHFACQAAFGDIDVAFAWEAWRLATSNYVLRGRRGIYYGTGLRLVARLGLVGRRGAAALCVAGVALMELGWVWWCAWAPGGRPGRRGTLRGGRGAWRLRPSFGVAGVALGDIHDLVTDNFVTHNLSHLSLTCNFIAHSFVTHNSFAQYFFHTHLSHTQLCHPQLCHTHNLSHTSLSHATSLSHTSLSHTTLSHSSFTHNFVTHHLSHTHTHAALSHTTLSHTTF